MLFTCFVFVVSDSASFAYFSCIHCTFSVILIFSWLKFLQNYIYELPYSPLLDFATCCPFHFLPLFGTFVAKFYKQKSESNLESFFVLYEI